MVGETTEFEGIPEVEKAVNYVCIKECFWGSLYKVGDPLVYKGDHPMLKSFKIKEGKGPVEEVLEDEEPETLAGIEEHTARETIASVNREGIKPDALETGQAPEPGVEELLK